VDRANPESGIRILGVLQRIALAYFFASLSVYFFKIRGAFLVSVLFLLLYWWLCLAFGNAADPFSMQGWFGNAIDRSVLGVAHMYKGEGVPFEPEGIASTLPAIAQVIFGYFAGDYIQKKGKNAEMLTNLFIAGCMLIFTALCWEMVFPINKKIWTSSYVLYTTGLAILILAIMIHIIEFRNWKGAWTRFFDVFGKNPLFIFFLSGFLPRLLALIRWKDHVNAEGKTTYTSPLPWFYEHICKPLFDNLKNGSLLYALALVLFYWAICYWLDKRRIYIKV
jgi:predicted acyltransferase